MKVSWTNVNIYLINVNNVNRFHANDCYKTAQNNISPHVVVVVVLEKSESASFIHNF